MNVHAARPRHARLLPLGLLSAAIAACGSLRAPPASPPPDPDAVRARIASLLPPQRPAQRSDWIADLQAAFEALRIEPSDENLCAVLAVTEQESGYQTNPVVPGLPAIARREIEQRAAEFRIPRLAVAAALALPSTDGRSYRERLDAATTEKALNDLFEDFIGRVPLGRRLFANLNPVRTAGPMQVGIEFAQQHAKHRPYPFPLAEGRTLRDELFTRRGGLYFGIAHLLDYRAAYEDPIFRFADYNAGHYASRNAAFQNAVSLLARTRLALDGDLLVRAGAARDEEAASAIGETERALQRIATRLGLDEPAIRADLERGDALEFEETRTYRKVFELTDALPRRDGTARPVPRALLPQIRLRGPKISRALTTEWFAKRVDARYERCLARAGANGR